MFHCGTTMCFSYRNVLALCPVPSGTIAVLGGTLWTSINLFHYISISEKLKYFSFKEMF